MHDILKERVWRRLQALPQEQLYQVLDYVEFLEAKYAKEQAVKADPIQKFAERLEDGMRMRSVAPKVISGTVGLLGTARRVMRTVSDAGREMLGEAAAAGSRPPAEPGGRKHRQSTGQRQEAADGAPGGATAGGAPGGAPALPAAPQPLSSPREESDTGT
jgi:hypothetical protein